MRVRRLMTGLSLSISILVAAAATPLAVAVADAEPPSADAIRDLLSSGQYSEAEEASRALVDRIEEEETSEPEALAEALDLLVESLWRGGRTKPQETLDLAERAVVLKESTYGESDPGVAVSLTNLARVLIKRGGDEQVRPLLERAVAIQEKSLGPEDPALMGTLSAFGSHLRDEGDFEGSEAMFLRVAAIGEKAPEHNPRAVAINLVNLANIYDDMGAFDTAIPYHERSIEAMEKVHGGDHPELAAALNAYGVILWRLGEYRRAAAIHRRALAMREKTLGPDHRQVAAALNNLSLDLQSMGDLASARPLLERAVEIWKKALAADHFYVAQGYNNLGTLAGRLGDFEEAQRLLEDALAIREKRFGAVHPAVGQTLVNIGKVHRALREDDRAREILQRAIDVHEESLGPDSPFVATARIDLGHLLADAGEFDAARSEFERTLAILEASVGEGNVQSAEPMSALGDLHRRLGDFDRARELQQEALAIRVADLGPDHPEVAMSLVSLAEVDLDLRRFTEARDGAARAARLLQRHLRTTLGAVTESEALMLLGTRVRPETILFSGLIADGGNRSEWLQSCWEWTLGQRGLVLEEMAGRSLAARAGSSAEAAAAWSHLTVASRQLAALWNRGVGQEGAEAYRRLLAGASREKEEAEIAMARVSDRLGRPASLVEPGTKEIRAALPSGGALIEIARVSTRAPGTFNATPHDIALILGGEGRMDAVDLGPSSGIDERVAAWRRALHESSGLDGDGDLPAAAWSELIRIGADLREAIWEPLASRIGEARTVFLVPDGSIHQVNFATLPDEGESFLIEGGPSIHLLGSARDLVRLAGASAHEAGTGRGVLALGAPDFDAPLAARLNGLEPTRIARVYRGARTACTPVSRIEWPDLPQSAREVARIESLFANREPVAALLGAGASEERLKAEAAGKSTLHLATHGYFLQGECASIMQENPLLLSGLVLAGANDDGTNAREIDDGILTAEEVAALDLEGVKLAVLSACDTGRGEIAIGEGVYGLRRAFELAGARSVIMSLWPTPDVEARHWMETFYRANLEGASIPEATRRASLANLDMLRESGEEPHPYLWGGFVAAGDWR